LTHLAALLGVEFVVAVDIIVSLLERLVAKSVVDRPPVKSQFKDGRSVLCRAGEIYLFSFGYASFVSPSA